MASKLAWGSYPLTFCATEIATISRWIQLGQSGSVIGLPGAGKSNLLGFIGHRPDVISSYLQCAPAQVATIHVDLNNLTGNDLATFYRVILRAMYEANDLLKSLDPTIPLTVEALYRKVEEKTDPFLAQSACREVVMAFRAREIRLVLVLDPFDPFLRSAPTQVIDNLRGLRDSFKRTLTYVVGVRQELHYLRAPAEIGELYDILDSHICWVGPLSDQDARYSIAQVEEALGRSFTEEQVRHLLELSGGYPALLRAATLWLAALTQVPPLSEWVEYLMALPGMQNRLKDMWDALSVEEQGALSNLQTALSDRSNHKRQEGLKQIEQKYALLFVKLQSKHICQFNDTGWKLFSPLFARWVSKLEGVVAGKIQFDSLTERFSCGDVEFNGLSEQDRRLLRNFLEHPFKVFSLDELQEVVWADKALDGAANQAIQQAIRHLRTQIEINPAKPRYLITVHKVGYRFFPEGAPENMSA